VDGWRSPVYCNLIRRIILIEMRGRGRKELLSTFLTAVPLYTGSVFPYQRLGLKDHAAVLLRGAETEGMGGGRSAIMICILQNPEGYKKQKPPGV